MLIYSICIIIMLSLLDKTIRGGRIDLLIIGTRQQLRAIAEEIITAAWLVSPADPYHEEVYKKIIRTSNNLEQINLYTFIAGNLAQTSGQKRHHENLLVALQPASFATACIAIWRLSALYAKFFAPAEHDYVPTP